MQQITDQMQSSKQPGTVRRFSRDSIKAAFHSLDVGQWEIKQKFVGKDYDYHHFNCATLIVLVYAELGIDVVVDPLDCTEENLFKRTRQGFFDNYHKQWEKVEDPKFPDIVLFENNNGIIYHGGIVVNNNKVLHCCFKTGVVVSRLGQLKRKSTLNGFYRWKQ